MQRDDNFVNINHKLVNNHFMSDVAVWISYDFVNVFQKIMSCTRNRENVRVLLDRIHNNSNTGGNIYEV